MTQLAQGQLVDEDLTKWAEDDRAPPMARIDERSSVRTIGCIGASPLL